MCCRLHHIKYKIDIKTTFFARMNSLYFIYYILRVFNHFQNYSMTAWEPEAVTYWINSEKLTPYVDAVGMLLHKMECSQWEN